MMRWAEERIQEHRSGASLQYVLLQNHQGFSKHRWPSLEGMRAIKQRPCKICTWWTPSRGGQWQSCVDEVTSPMLLNVRQLSEAILSSVSFNSMDQKDLVSKCLVFATESEICSLNRQRHVNDKCHNVIRRTVFTGYQSQKSKLSKQ